MLYSASARGFFDPAINPVIPTDAVTLSDETYQSLMDGQVAGKVIVPDKDGNPVLEDPSFSTKEMTDLCQATAETRLFKSDWTQAADVMAMLENVQEFVEYRAIVRNLRFNPVPNPVFPDEPAAVWKVQP